MIAQRHVHMNFDDAKFFNVKDKNSYYLADNWYVLAEMTEDGYKRVTQKSNTNGINS